jgi:glycosyltransferase involved in cell wall biosynthesis
VAPRGALPEVCDDAALYADPAHPQAWSDALDILQRDPAVRQSFVGKGQRRAGNFKWGTSARQLMALIEELSASKPQ